MYMRATQRNYNIMGSYYNQLKWNRSEVIVINTEDGKIWINWQVFSNLKDIEFADDIYLITTDK